MRARLFLITAPHIQWFEQTRLVGNVFFERVHPDHCAWYSPITLLRTLEPFIDAERDDVEVFLLNGGASVGSTRRGPTRRHGVRPWRGCDERATTRGCCAASR